MEISDIFKGMRKFWWLVLSVTLTLAIVTFVKTSSDKSTYSSTIDLKTTQSQVQVVNINNKQDTTQQGKAVSTLYADILNSTTFNSEVIESATGIKNEHQPSSLRIKAEQSPGSNYLTLVVETDNFSKTKRITEAAANVLIKRVEKDSLGNAGIVREEAQAKLKAIDKKLKVLRKQLFVIQKKISFFSKQSKQSLDANVVIEKATSAEIEKGTKITKLYDEISDALSLRQAYTDYLNRIEVSNFSQASAIRIVSEASKPVKVSKQYARDIGLSVVVGLLISLALALFLDSINKKETES